MLQFYTGQHKGEATWKMVADTNGTKDEVTETIFIICAKAPGLTLR